jgi:hypothetical protein
MTEVQICGPSFENRIDLFPSALALSSPLHEPLPSKLAASAEVSFILGLLFHQF